MVSAVCWENIRIKYLHWLKNESLSKKGYCVPLFHWDNDTIWLVQAKKKVESCNLTCDSLLVLRRHFWKFVLWGPKNFSKDNNETLWKTCRRNFWKFVRSCYRSIIKCYKLEIRILRMGAKCTNIFIYFVNVQAKVLKGTEWYILVLESY